jgi:hypothetical protein
MEYELVLFTITDTHIEGMSVRRDGSGRELYKDNIVIEIEDIVSVKYEATGVTDMSALKNFFTCLGVVALVVAIACAIAVAAES